MIVSACCLSAWITAYFVTISDAAHVGQTESYITFKKEAALVKNIHEAHELDALYAKYHNDDEHAKKVDIALRKYGKGERGPPLVEAVATANDFEAMTNLILVGTNVANVKCKLTGHSILHFVAIRQDDEKKGLDLITLILYGGYKGRDLINSIDDYGRTPLIVSVMYNRTLLTTFLISEGADSSVEDKFGNTAFSIAKKRGYSGCITILQKALDASRKRGHRQQGMSLGAKVIEKYSNHVYGPPLIEAAYAKDWRSLKILLQNSPDLMVTDWQYGSTLLHLLAGEENDMDSLVSLVLDWAELQVDEFENILNAKELYGEGNTPLMIAVHYRNINVARVLIKRGADITQRNRQGQTVLNLARLNKVGDDDDSRVRGILEMLEEVKVEL
jgi:ankyrin repeat protein